jgi:DNA ligase (NAD+)
MEIVKHRFMYYSGKPEISNEQYDELEKELKSLDPNNELFLKIGFECSQSDFTKVKHREKMISLGKTYSIDETLNWFSNLSQEEEYICSHKIDGFAINLEYKYNGIIKKHILSRACSRGSGDVGEDITENIKQISGIPFTISSELQLPNEFEVRGEIYTKKSILKQLIENKIVPEDTSIRNISAGSCRQKDPMITKERKLCFYSYDIINYEYKTFKEALKTISVLGFEVIPHDICKINDILNYSNNVFNNRNSLDYPIDGIVVRVNDNKTFKEMGNTSHHPKGAVALKPEAESSETFLNDIIWQVSRTGLLNPVALLRPVIVGDVEVSKTTLHNISYIDDLKLTKNCKVKIARMGDVIPKLTEVIEHYCDEMFGIPTECPICSSHTTINISDSNIKTICCSNQNCKGRKISNLDYYASIMEFKGISEAIIEKLFDKNILNNISDFFKLKDKKEIMLTIDGFKIKSVNNIIDAVEKNKNKTFDIILCSLGISGLGKTVSKLIADNFDKEYILNNLTQVDLLGITGIGEEISKSVIIGLKEFSSEITEILSFVNIIDKNKSTGGLNRKTFCCTGTLSLPRTKIHEMIEQNGGIVCNSVTKTLDFLIAGEDCGSKLDKAKKNGVSILSEQNFIDMIGVDYVEKKEDDSIKENIEDIF